MTLFLLDTDTASYVINDYAESVGHRFDRLFPFQRAISAITYAELLMGLSDIRVGHPRLRAAGKFLATIRVLEWSADAASIFAHHWIQMEKLGNRIGQLDTMIAAHALALEATLVTNNTRHFSRIPNLRLENWLE